jgi:hypothetical protein
MESLEFGSFDVNRRQVDASSFKVGWEMRGDQSRRGGLLYSR